MTHIFPVTALQKNSTEVRSAAKDNIVHITENGRSSYIFASESAFDEYVAEQRAAAAREALLFQAIDEGEADLKEGNTHSADSVDELYDQLDSPARPSQSRTVA